MLILSRRVGETLNIGDDIKLTVMAVHGNQVRIGIVAPRTVVVDREEISVKRKRDAELAALLRQGPASVVHD